ncbi:MAG TPA: S-adenosylmethionine decarboxylase [Persephonella sp.]|uniref:S-adenosylmethionine decarboxylase proenzyme n=1 Tax=Persephonella marina (strain DSM 14350 / EX-H1) TaxID=123214 RepID=SPEH_PERMH|nr:MULTISPECIES: adenosylmethionine decarboxylase [Persephonella]C0QRY8.1 RecName: Full=S-adenosylmethionine decarboxylase proenzyme; Short=AdoMetDC; Short=SAMDC; Contains: RecName: Full=S-adenosylmethionine decarboxylase beta chain; Contains: RecName: Full=S-adenosylmethionine decarboxylase alpha chain; Flags: Precursor [Persephonella marina EX-H1]ACO03754.1 S-adenosylmethionine decarboxylase proenzyme [Persephonella marina EX-H1]HCB69179.1 S-adenosylmethionine decarboxylase [Persephonella sp.]
MEKTLGLHILADLYGVEFDKIDHVEDVRELLEGAVKYAGLSKLSSHFHQFYPHGATGVILLEESHISIHTWPEHGYAAIDVYTCGGKEKTFKAMEYILKVLKPKRIDEKVAERGTVPVHKEATHIEKIELETV